MSTNTYAGKVAIITGGASGIGAAIGKALAERGAEVVLTDRQTDLAERVSSEIRAKGGRARTEELDVRSMQSMTRMVEATLARSGKIDYLFNNAGIGVGGEVGSYELRDWDDVIDVNLRGVIHGIQAVYPLMIRQRSGHIVNTASMAGLFALAQVSYTTTKHAVVGLSKALRIEAKVHGVHVSVLCPGAIRTPILTGGKYGRSNMVGLTDTQALEAWEKLKPMDADQFAQKALQAIANDQAIIVLPRWWKVLWYLDRLSPTMSMKLAERALRRSRTFLDEAGVKPAKSAHTAENAPVPENAPEPPGLR